MDNAELTKAFGAFFAIMNPFVNLPMFLALTAGFTVVEQRRLALKVVIFSAVMCLLILLAGQQVMNFFGITVDEFRIAGGVVLAHIAWSMLNGNSIASHHGTDKERDHMQELSSLAFYPITFPMLVGPGTIATLIIYTGHAKGIEGMIAIGGVVASILALLFVVFFFAAFFGKVMSDTMRVIMSRLMGMILLVIALEMIVVGTRVVFPGLA